MTPTPDHEALEKAYDAAGKTLFMECYPSDGDADADMKDARRTAKLAITTFLSSLDGYKLIAREPTDAAIDAAGDALLAWAEKDGNGHSLFGRSPTWLRLVSIAAWDAAPDITKKGTE
jgi:hypothetical protein